MEFKINKHIIRIYYKDSTKKNLPVILLNTFEDEGQRVWDKCQEINCNDFILVSISNIDWNKEMSPWKCPPLFKGDEGYFGEADEFLKEIEDDILPKSESYIKNELHKDIEYLVLAGYSLAGLFALYTSFNTNLFTRIICVSASFWYPNFVNYVKNNEISNRVSRIYFSLGNKEHDTKNIVLKSVLDNTLDIYKHLSSKIDCIYEENMGGHFKDNELRIAKGIKRILS